MSDSLSCSKCGAVLPAGGVCGSCAADFLAGELTVAPGDAFDSSAMAASFPSQAFSGTGRWADIARS